MPRFAVLHHDWPTPHYDLLLEADGVLKAWRLPAEPGADQVIVPNADHRLHYLDYEGPVGDDRGTVRQWDRGNLTWIIDEPGRIIVDLRGRHLKGLFQIRLFDGGHRFRKLDDDLVFDDANAIQKWILAQQCVDRKGCN